MLTSRIECCRCRKVLLASAWLVAGSAAWAGDPNPTVLAVKAGTIYVGDGREIDNGVVIVRDGRIAEVGSALAIPKGAKVISLPAGTVTPGLIDANAAIDPGEGAAPQRPARRPRDILHDFFCPRHHHEPVLGCCGSTCPEYMQHTSGEHCPVCGFPDSAPDTVSGVRLWSHQVEDSAEVVPHTRILDTVNLRAPDFARLAAGGVTTVFVAPETSAVISARGAIVRTGGTYEGRILRDADAVKAAMGSDPSWRGSRNERPWREFVTFRARRPTTRMGVAWVFRKAMYDTRRHVQGLPVSGADAPSPEAMAVLAEVLSGEIPLRIQARMQHDILTALRLTEEFGLRFTLVEATEAHRCLDELRSRDVPVVYGPIYVDALGYRGASREVENARLHTFRALLAAGVTTALTAHELRDEDGLARQGMYALRFGASLPDVLRATTATPAQMLGLADEIGTLEAGKAADLVLWSGTPFAADARPVVVVIGGEVVVDRRKG